MMLQRLATGATGVKQARSQAKGTRTRMRSIYTTLGYTFLIFFFFLACDIKQNKTKTKTKRSVKLGHRGREGGLAHGYTRYTQSAHTYASRSQ